MAIEVACLGLPFQGPTHFSIEPDPSLDLTLRELVTRYLAPHFDGNLVDALFDENGLREEFVVLVNGRNAAGLSGPGTPLGNKAEVLIMPPVGGG